MTAPGRHVVPAQQLLRRTSLPRQMKLEAESHRLDSEILGELATSVFDPIRGTFPHRTI
jgi:hypothetical protein